MTARPRPAPRAAAGFTLVELLVVLSILAAIAGVASQFFQPTLGQARQEVGRSAMRDVAGALTRYRADLGRLPATSETGSSLAERHPADLKFLFSKPGDAAAWNPDTGRGWRGPYLSGFGTRQVRVGARYPASPGGDAGAPAGASWPVTAVADSFPSRPDNGFLQWTDARDEAVTGSGNPLLLFVWETNTLKSRGCAAPCLVSLGPDGRYGTDDDVILNF